ncbi:MAG: divergent PAP2 family protein [Lachnospiraceae bacterium]|nr:divergent PAP2 family protein [Lachnospiraceae bacterium]
MFSELLMNRVLISGLIGWASAQTLKTIIYALVNRRIDLSRLLGDGGMPSAHSSTVVSVAVAVAFESGLASPVFALAAIFAFITMHDASGVRLETGKQAKAINEIFLMLSDMDDKIATPEEKLKELVGHTKLQVLMGGLLGFLVTTLSYMIVQT